MPRVIQDTRKWGLPGFARGRNGFVILLVVLALTASALLAIFSHPILAAGLFAGLIHRIWLYSQKRLPAHNWQ